MNQWHCTTGCSIYSTYLNVSSIYSMCNWFIEFHHECLSNFTGISLLLHKRKMYDDIQLGSLDFRCSQHSFVWVPLCETFMFRAFLPNNIGVPACPYCTQVPSLTMFLFLLLPFSPQSPFLFLPFSLQSPFLLPPFSSSLSPPSPPFSSDATLYTIQLKYWPTEQFDNVINFACNCFHIAH